MKKLIPVFLLLLPAVIFSFGGSCDNGAVVRGSFTYDGNLYNVHNALIVDYGATNGSYNLDFEAASSGINLMNYTGKGDGFYIELFSPNPTLASGTYNYDTNLNPFTFDYAEIYINWDITSWTGTYFEATAGTVTVTVNGAEYTVEFNWTLTNGKTATGNYTGPAPTY